MQIVIDLPEELKEALDNAKKETAFNYMRVYNDTFYDAIKNGIPLPKGHGRLIDADALNIRMEQRMNEIGDDESIWESSNVATALDMFAPTIVEADTEGEDKE